MARVPAPPLALAGLAPCLSTAGLTWEHAAHSLRISPATLRSYASRGAPLGMITALTLLLDLPNHSPRPLFVRPTEGLRVRTAREPHRARPHQPTLRRAEEQQAVAADHTPEIMPCASQRTRIAAGQETWEQLPMQIVAT